MKTVRRGFDLFVWDLRHSLSLSITFVIALLAFVLALFVATGFRL